MASDPPPPYPGGPTAPLLEEKHGTAPAEGNIHPHGGYPAGMPYMPPDSGPPPYEANPGYIAPNPGIYPPPGPYAPMGYYPPTAGPYPTQGPYPAPYPSPGTHATTVIMPPGASAASAATTVTVLQGETFNSSPVQTVCPHCQQPIITKISHEVGLMNFLLCCFCCFVGCDLGCCLIPCMINDLKDVTHSCPSCKAYIYTYRRMG
ncbi:cell death-inducing p53-target protein 1 [Spea bombifrons]|uniref:cell death-inducing p53-target protein 1 n=1 Tax=Spea bombifrons TaxID=233779 RepID=UPI00234B55E5|nr:cell death-inducing p53-target protein 1 [Spea bombifrons]XP_053326859.1 cell death-inducing p53-target protein 1 [Spea bombifrons]